MEEQNRMYLLKYIFIFLVFCFLPIWLQLILFVVSCIVAPGGNIVLLIAMVVGIVLKLIVKIFKG